MEKNLIHGEIEEELESRADGGSYSERKAAVQVELRGAELENYGVEPRREADESKGEDYVYGRVIAVLEPELKVFSLLMKNATICARRFETLNAMKSASPQR